MYKTNHSGYVVWRNKLLLTLWFLNQFLLPAVSKMAIPNILLWYYIVADRTVECCELEWPHCSQQSFYIKKKNSY